MNAEIIAVGSELLLGQIENTNATFLSQELSKLGVNVYFHTVVGDNPIRLKRTIEEASNRSDLVVLCGGLGPTKDDLTKEAVSAVIGSDLEYDSSTKETIETFFRQRKQAMTENNLKQALIISGSYVLKNDYGLACGMVKKHANTQYLLLPGPPKEMKPMFINYAIPYLNEQIDERYKIESKVLRFYNIGESRLVTLIDDLLEEQTNPTIAPLAGDGEVTLRITVKGLDLKTNKELLETTKKKILARTSEFYYGEGEETLESRVQSALKKNKLLLSSAESFTGGLFAEKLTSLPGVSSVFNGGIVCYSNKVKETVLSVSSEVLKNEGAVSAECAKLLAENVKEIFSSDIGISFTGSAGPDSIEGHEPGHVFIGLAMKERTEVFELHLAGSRQGIRERSVKYGFFRILERL